MKLSIFKICQSEPKVEEMGEQPGGEKKSAVAEMMTVDTAKKVLAEIIGTLLLVLMGCMGCLPGWAHGPPSHLQLSVAFGLVVMFIIQIIGHVSGAHINPSITVAALICGSISIPMSVLYFISQCVGASLGYGLLTFLTPDYVFNTTDGFCVTKPGADVSALQAVFIEAIITGILILVTCSIWDPCNSHNSDGIPIKFGFTIAALALTGGGYTGASMNPARSLGPAIWNNDWESHWIYWVGPLLGSIVAAFLYQQLFHKGKPKMQPEEVPLNELNDKSKMESV